jgi:hypothetical protein
MMADAADGAAAAGSTAEYECCCECGVGKLWEKRAAKEKAVKELQPLREHQHWLMPRQRQSRTPAGQQCKCATAGYGLT